MSGDSQVLREAWGLVCRSPGALLGVLVCTRVDPRVGSRSRGQPLGGRRPSDPPCNSRSAVRHRRPGAQKTQQRQVGQISMGSTLQFHLMVATISPLMSSGTHSEPSRDHAFQLSTTELCENSYGTILERSWNYPGTTSELRRNRPFKLCFHGFLSGQFLLPVPLIKILLKAQGVGTTSRERARTGAS